jgi:hypothetical protein
MFEAVLFSSLTAFEFKISIVPQKLLVEYSLQEEFLPLGFAFARGVPHFIVLGLGFHAFWLRLLNIIKDFQCISLHKHELLRYE